MELPGLKKPILKVPLEETSVWSPESVKLAEIVSAAAETWMQRRKTKKKERVEKKETMRKAWRKERDEERSYEESVLFF